MSSIQHVIAAILYWLYANLASVGISVVVTAVGGLIMWPLIFRKTRLEIEHLRIDTRRLELEVQKMTDEKIQREATKNLANLSERIVELAKKSTKDKPSFGSSAPFSEEELRLELKDSPEAISKALQTLKAQGRASYRGQVQKWIIKV